MSSPPYVVLRRGSRDDACLVRSARCFLLATAALVPLLSCSGSAGSAGSSADGAPQVDEDEESFDHHLKLTVDGVTYEAYGHPFGPAMVFSAPEVNVQVGGPLKSAVDSGKSVSLGDYDMIMNVYTNGLEPGDYELRSNRSSVSRAADEERGFAEVFFRSEAPFSHLVPLRGTVTIESVKGRADGQSYRTERVRGRVQGTFRGQGAAEHEVSGSFDYRR